MNREKDKPSGYFLYPDKNGELVAKIPLTQKKFAVVDVHNADKFAKYDWRYNDGYASRKVSNKNRKMHHDVIKCQKGFIIDHINHNGLDNRENNIRLVTYRENAQNHRSTQYTSKYPGVCWDKNRQKWIAYIKIKGKQKFLGRFVSEEQAYNAYLNAVP